MKTEENVEDEIPVKELVFADIQERIQNQNKKSWLAGSALVPLGCYQKKVQEVMDSLVEAGFVEYEGSKPILVSKDLLGIYRELGIEKEAYLRNEETLTKLQRQVKKQVETVRYDSVEQLARSEGLRKGDTTRALITLRSAGVDAPDYIRDLLEERHLELERGIEFLEKSDDRPPALQ